MQVTHSERGFEIVEHPVYPPTGRTARLLQASSAIGEAYEDGFDNPGSSFLWVSDQHHLNREEVREMMAHCQAWLASGSLHVQPEGFVLADGEHVFLPRSNELQELHAEITRLRECARAQEERVCRLEIVDGSIVITAPFGTDETEREIGAAFIEMYRGLEQMAKALLPSPELDDLNDAESELTRLKTDVGKAAQYLPVAGPLSHRVRMFKEHYSAIILRQRDLLMLARTFISGNSYDMTMGPELVEQIDQELAGNPTESEATLES